MASTEIVLLFLLGMSMVPFFGWDCKEESSLKALVAIPSYGYAQERNNAIEKPTL